MIRSFANRIEMTVASAPGAGATIALGPATDGRQSLQEIGAADGSEWSFVFEEPGGATWEYGRYTFHSGPNTLTRTEIFASTNAGNAINASAGVIGFHDILAEDFRSIQPEQLTWLGTGVATALGNAAGAAGGFALQSALGTAAFAAATAFLAVSSNLADLNNVATARSNLGLGALATKSAVDLSTADVSGNLGVAHLGGGSGASASTFWRGDGTWAAPPLTAPSGVTGQLQYNNAGAFAAANAWTDGASYVELRNGITAQALRACNTYSDPANYERGGLAWVGNDLVLGTEAVGTGVQRKIKLSAPAFYGIATRIDLGSFADGGAQSSASGGLGFVETQIYQIRLSNTITSWADTTTKYGFLDQSACNVTSGAAGVYQALAIFPVVLATDTITSGLQAISGQAANYSTNLSGGIFGMNFGAFNFAASSGKAVYGMLLTSYNDQAATTLSQYGAWIRWQNFGGAGASYTLSYGLLVEINGSSSSTYSATASQVLRLQSNRTAFDFIKAVNGANVYFKLDGTGNLTLFDGANLTLGTVTGTKIGTAATEKLGFFNAAPAAQPAGTGETVGFTANAGTAVNDASVFTGNVGATAYRISDIVKALKQVGLLAA